MQPYVLATYTRRRDAETAIRRVRSQLPAAEVRLGDTDDALDALALGQRAEMSESGPVLAGAMHTGPQLRGLIPWGAVGLLVGVALLVPFAWTRDTGELSTWVVAGLLALGGTMAGATVGVVLGASARTVKEGETTPEDPTAVVRAEVPAGETAPVVELLVASGARSARVVSRPVERPPTDQVETPRPMRTDPSVTSGTGSDSDAGFPADVPGND